MVETNTCEMSHSDKSLKSITNHQSLKLFTNYDGALVIHHHNFNYSVATTNHEKGEEGEKLGKTARPRILDCVPQP